MDQNAPHLFTTNQGFAGTDVSAQTIAFSPSSISGLVAWYDFNDSATVSTVSGKVSQITDKGSGNVTMSQATAGIRPTYAATGGYNNRGRATFTRATGTYLLGGGATTFMGVGTAFSIAARVKGAAQSRGTIIGRSAGVNPDVFLCSGEGSTSLIKLWVNDTVNGIGAGPETGVAFDDTWHSIMVTWSYATGTGTWNYWLDGTQTTTDYTTPGTMDFSAAASQTFMLGGVNSASPTLIFSGDIEYVAVYNKVLTTANAVSFTNYGS